MFPFSRRNLVFPAIMTNPKVCIPLSSPVVITGEVLNQGLHFDEVIVRNGKIKSKLNGLKGKPLNGKFKVILIPE